MADIKKLCVVSCPIASRSGYGSRSRDFVRGLIKSKPNWDIKILSQRWGNTPMDALTEDDDDLLSRVLTEKLQSKPDVWIQITVPNEFQPVGGYNIGVTAGVETTIMPHDCIEGMNRMDLNLISSEFGKEVSLKTQYEKKDKQTNQVVGSLKLVKPIEVVFEGINLDVYDEKAPNEPRIDKVLKDVKEDFAFLFVGHWLSGEFQQDRKNVGGLIWTFLETFKNNPKAPALILKTNSGHNSLPDRVKIKKMIESIKKNVDAKQFPNIYLLHSDLSDVEMNALYNHPKIKAHISFTRGEGFGRPLLEATISGKPIIVSGWSGHMDFLNPEYITLLGGKLDNVHKSAANQFLLEDGQWFTVDYNEAAGIMANMVLNYKQYLSASRKHRKYTKDNFSFDKMVERIGEVIDETKVPTQPKLRELKLPTLKKVE